MNENSPSENARKVGRKWVGEKVEFDGVKIFVLA